VTDRDARAYISELDKAEVTQAIIHDPSQVAAIRSYVDDLRCKFPDVSDSDIGWMVQWVSSFILTAQQQHGDKVTAESMMMTFALMSRELLLLEASPSAPDDSGT
jgi:hypothetical protein